MKFDRRSFLSFVIGGAAGTAISPLPWKMMDDSSIWSQMWPWTPVPEDGEVNYVNTACKLCSGGCGITVTKIEDRAVKIEGTRKHPVNDGGICILGLSGLQLLYGPTRVKTPMKRAGKRGEGKWENISWKEALSTVVKQLGSLKSQGEPHTLACISGSDHGTVPSLFKRFLTAYGSPNFISAPSIQDSYELTMRLTKHSERSPGFDIENADYILSFGSGLIEGWGSPVRMFKANSSGKQTGTKVVQVEPRLSTTAAKADKWLPAKPGTETALALGFAHVIIKESLYNKSFVEHYAVGFKGSTDDQGNNHPGFKQLILENYSPEKVAKITGIGKSEIVSLAREFARATYPIAVCGRGIGDTPGNMDEFIAVQTLNALVGNINKKGGIWQVPENDYINWPNPGEISKERIDGAGSKEYPHSKHLLNRFADSISSGKGYPVKALFVTDSNPSYSLPDSKNIKKAFDKIPFIVSFSSYMDETAQQADIILPNHTYLERYEDVPAPFGLKYPVVSLSKPVVKPLCNTMHSGDTLILMAKNLGGRVANAFPWKNYETCLKKTLGSKWKTLDEKGVWSNPGYRPAPWYDTFSKDSEKFRFISDAKDGVGTFPKYNPVKPEGGVSYPLVLVPYDSVRIASGYIGNPPFVMKTVEETILKGNDTLVEINPETAAEYGFKEGSYAKLVTPKGTAKVKVHLYDGIMPGLIALPRGLGHKAYDKYLADKGVNINELIGPVEDAVSGLDAAWGIRAKLSKA